MTEPITGYGEIASRLARAVGLDPADTVGFTIDVHADDVVRVRAVRVADAASLDRVAEVFEQVRAETGAAPRIDVVCRGCSNTGYDISGRPCSCGLAEPITEDWLARNGWRDQHRPETLGLHRRLVGDEVLGGRPFLGASDDLCIDVMPGSGGEWFCWVHQQEPRRHIHVRHVRYTWELVRLWEGFTGRTWPGK